MNNWTYEEAFKRNLGLINAEEQKKLRSSNVAIIGQGGVGGVHLVTLARLGIGKFSIADFDTFEAANFNRQYGATVSTIGKSKVDVMARIAKEINPEIEIRAFTEPIGPKNAAEFLKGADVLIDGIDAFEIDVRRLLFRLAAEQGSYAVTAGPIGFSAAWLVFGPNSMSFDRYFDFSDDMDANAKFLTFMIGLTPKVTHRSYIDMRHVNLKNRYGPSAGLACELCAGVAAAETVKILLGRGLIKCAPHFRQFDAYKGKLKSGYLLGGNRHPFQRFKRWWFTRHLRKLGQI